MAIQWRLVSLLALGWLTHQSVVAETIVEYTFADENASTATNTGTLGAAMNGSITGGSIIDSPLSPDGKGLLLGGTNGDGIAMQNGFDFGGEFTVSILARLDSYQNAQSILFDDYGQPGVLLTVDTATEALRFTIVTADDSPVSVTSDTTFSLGEWHQVHAVYNGSGAFLVQDGAVVGSIAATGSVDNHPNVTPNVGIESDDTVFPWNGAVDDFSISDRAIAVPEPSALVALSICCLLVDWYRRGTRR